MAISTSRNRAAAFHALDKRHRPAMVRRLHRFFVAQARRVVERYLAEFSVKASALDQPATQPPQPEELLPTSEWNSLWLVLLPYLLQVILDALNMAGDMVGLDAVIEMDPRVQRLLLQAQLHLAGVHRTTLNAVRTTLAEGFSQGYSPRQIAYGVPQDHFDGLASSVAETYSGRALTIAETEIVTARQHAALERYQEAGIAMVLVSDGAGCGWESHDSGGEANGTVRTLLDANNHPLGHPHCHRAFTPVR